LLRSERSMDIGKNTLTIRTVFSPRHSVHIHPHARRICAWTGMPSQRNQSDSFRFKRAAFYQSLKSKVGLAAAKAGELRINLITSMSRTVA
jgi:hypothetical protein